MATQLKLTAEEERALERLEERYKIIRLQTLLAAKGHSTGACVWGEGGIGKSYQVLKTLDEKKFRYKVVNSRLSAAGFVDLLEKHRKGILVIEDIENVFDEGGTLNLLRSSLWGQEDVEGKMRRPITWGIAASKSRTPKNFEFEGTILFTSNRDLRDIPELRAVRTRIPVVRLEPDRDEILAVGKKIALGGYSWHKGTLPPETCLTIFEFYRDNIPADALPNLRILTRFYRQYMGLEQEGEVDAWRQLFLADIHGDLTPQVTTPASELARLEQIAADLRNRHGKNTQAILPVWRERTGRKTLDSYYDALRRLG